MICTQIHSIDDGHSSERVNSRDSLNSRNSLNSHGTTCSSTNLSIDDDLELYMPSTSTEPLHSRDLCDYASQRDIAFVDV